jgi:hypothetical protein
VIEFTGPQSWKYQAYFLRPMMTGIGDASPDIRQACSYCIGLCGLKGGADYFPASMEALSYLGQVILHPDSRKRENITATENAISAVGKISQALANTPGFDLNTALSHWVQALPILHDQEEADFSYRYLLSLMER